jgi:curved DNA-binding protein CbpA
MYNNRLISKLWCNVAVKTTVVVLIIIGFLAVLSSIGDSQTTLVEAATLPLPSPYGSSNRNPYQILGVPITATPKEIKRQYYKLCLKYHPDKQSSHLSLKQRQRNEQLFKHIQWAYSEVVRSPSSESWHNKDGGAYYGNRWKDDISRSSFANSFRSYLHRNSAADNAWKRPSQQDASSSTNGPSPSLFDHWNPYGNNPHGGLYRSSTSPSFFGRTNPSFVWKNQHQSRMYPDPSASLCPRIADITVSSIEDTTRTTHFMKNSSKQALHQTISIATLFDRVDVKISSSLPFQRYGKSKWKR